MKWKLCGREFSSRLILGTARYPSPEILQRAITNSGTELVTVSLRRQDPAAQQKNSFWNLIQQTHVSILPNTAGCRNAKEAIMTATLARELFRTKWIKLEVIGDEYTLQPDPWGLVEAAEALIQQGFEVFPYMTDDLVLADKLIQVGCKVLMPWASPIGSGKGLLNPYALRAMRARFPDVPLIVDAGIGRPSQALAAMELGFDGVLVNTAVALADDPVEMAEAFSLAVQSGRKAFRSGLMSERDFAVPSTPVLGTPFRELT